MRKGHKKGSATADQSKAEPDYKQLEKELLVLILSFLNKKSQAGGKNK